MSPQNPEIVRDPNLARFIDLESHSGIFAFDVQYARPDNFLGRAVYSLPKAYLQKEVVEDLLRVSERLRRSGAGILVFDGYRPWSVTKIFWDESAPEARKFLANPERGSIHNRGCAIDCGLFDLATGAPLAMPSGFDEFSERAYRDYSGGESSARANRDLLIQTMEESGFRGIQHEWWHFNHPSAADHPLFDIPFELLSERR